MKAIHKAEIAAVTALPAEHCPRRVEGVDPSGFVANISWDGVVIGDDGNVGFIAKTGGDTIAGRLGAEYVPEEVKSAVAECERCATGIGHCALDGSEVVNQVVGAYIKNKFGDPS